MLPTAPLNRNYDVDVLSVAFADREGINHTYIDFVSFQRIQGSFLFDTVFILENIANYGTLNKPNRAIRLTELRKQTEECVMIKNNLEVDVKVKCLEEGITQAQLAERMEISPQYVNRVIKKNHNLLNKTFVNMMEAMGYDLQIVYVKREE